MSDNAFLDGRRLSARDVIQAFLDEGHDAGVSQLRILLRDGCGDEVDELAGDALLAWPPRARNLIDKLLCVVSEAALARLAARTVDVLEQAPPPDMRELCDLIIEAASLQIGPALQAQLGRLFALAPNRGHTCEDWPWRAAQAEDVAFLADQLVTQDPKQRRKAFDCLLETRRPDALALAIDAYPTMALPYPLPQLLRSVDHDGPGQPLYPGNCAHLIFPPDYIEEGSADPAPGAQHPSWTLPGDGALHRFGGVGSGTCGLCAGRLHHLVTLPEHAIFGMHGADASALSLEVCLSCLGWERGMLFYRHDHNGLAHALDHGAVIPQFPANPLAPTEVRLAPTPARWTWQSWGGGNLHRVGGPPVWIQHADYPDCPACARTMRFAMQLNSYLPTTDETEWWLWGSGGIGYVFQCHPCRTIGYFWQCT
ncbi:hypothetical protein [Massilia sp. CCM 8734]|uniref:hypothetical protein n=1 Tax=Massilia sp. CCM 8734 TaxID=2609283 RepID=UPI0014207446|nr:hypothetical protein [Massilia sp. CCM 8734]NHZ97617.1 hypothetical protein [Massilia sp. CCM 8734]